MALGTALLTFFGMTDRDAIEARIRSFIQDYTEWERACVARQSGWDMPAPCEIIDSPDPEEAIRALHERANEDTDHDFPRRTLEVVSRKHCATPDLLTRSGCSYGTPLRHDPELEQIVKLDLEPMRAKVVTSVPGGWISAFEYELKKIVGVWRIAGIDSFVGEDRAPEKRVWPAGAFRTLFSEFDDAGIDFGTAFVPGGFTHNTESLKREVIEVTRLGAIDVPSGMLIAFNPAEDPDEARPLEVKFVQPRLPVELARAGRYNAFVRVWLEPGTVPVAYVPARVVSAEQNEEQPVWEVGTRCGAIVLADAEAWTAMSSHDGQRFCSHMHDDETPTGETEERARLFSLPANQTLQGAVINRGGGDFGCPCYWGIDATGKAVALIVDLASSGDYVDEQIEIPCVDDVLDTIDSIPQLTEFGFAVRLLRQSPDQIAVYYRGERTCVDLVDVDGGVLASTDLNGYHTSEGDERIEFIPSVPPLEPGFRFRFRWKAWRHGFARANPLD